MQFLVLKVQCVKIRFGFRIELFYLGLSKKKIIIPAAILHCPVSMEAWCGQSSWLSSVLCDDKKHIHIRKDEVSR